MARTRRRDRASAGVTQLLVLDADGLSRAATRDAKAQAWLERARELDADVIVSAVTLAEVLRGGARDAGIDRVVKASDVWPADEQLTRHAGRLLGKASSDATVDAIVAATAAAGRQRHGAARCVVLTSAPHDLRMLLADEHVEVVAL